MSDLINERDDERANYDRIRHGLARWATERWNAEVRNRPLINVHRRALDDTWRQVIRYSGADDVAALGPKHSDLVAAAPTPTVAADAAAQEECTCSAADMPFGRCCKTQRIYQIGSPVSGGIMWWDVDRERYEREKKAGYMKTGIVYRVPA